MSKLEYTFRNWGDDHTDNYLMDLENFILDKVDSAWDFIQMKKARADNNEWISLIRKYLDKGVYETQEEQDEFVQRYKIWVKNGGGDDWFQED